MCLVLFQIVSNQDYPVPKNSNKKNSMKFLSAFNDPAAMDQPNQANFILERFFFIFFGFVKNYTIMKLTHLKLFVWSVCWQRRMVYSLSHLDGWLTV